MKVSIAIPVLLSCLWSCTAIVDEVVTGAISAEAVDVPAAEIAKPMHGHAHGIMTELQPPSAGDEERATRLAEAIKAGIARFQDLDVALEAGYEFFPKDPPPHLHIVHLVNNRYSRREAERFDPEKPGALLYERRHGKHGETGAWKLIGAMITAPVTATVAELDARAPLSVVRYHLHTDICVPRPIWDGEAWARTDATGLPVFGPESPITTTAECEAAGGRLLDTVFGWMAHCHVFVDNPADTWNQLYGH